MVLEFEFKYWKKNGISFLSCLVGLVFFIKYSKLFVIDRVFYVVFMVDMYCLVNVIFIVGGVEFGYVNGYGRKVRFRNLAGVVVNEG